MLQIMRSIPGLRQLRMPPTWYGLFGLRHHRAIVITGHPRCGTTSAASICQRLGREVGDEWVGAHGISSWMMAVDDRHNPYGDDELGHSRRNLTWDWLFLVVRDLATAVPSVMLENRFAPPSYEFRRKHIRKQLGIDLGDAPNEMARAVLSIICWSRIILRQSPDFSFRVEDQQTNFRDFLVEKKIVGRELSQHPVSEWENAAKIYGNGVRPAKPMLTPQSWIDLPANLSADVAWYCREFGYADPAAGR